MVLAFLFLLQQKTQLSSEMMLIAFSLEHSVLLCQHPGQSEVIEMITLTYERIMAILGLFTALCIAAGWLIKIFKALKKPGDDINQKLDRDNKRIRKLEDEMEYISSAKKYWVRIRTYKTVDGKTYYSAWSKAKTVTIKK